MFIIERRGFRLTKSFYFWALICFFGPLALTMHVHVGPRSGEPENPADG